MARVQHDDETLLLGLGAYGFSEAARLTEVPIQTARSWFLGRTDRSRSKPLFSAELPSVADRYAISFLGLIELLVVGKLRQEMDISFQYIRKAHARLETRLKTAHPFAHHRLKAGLRKVFVEIAHETTSSSAERECLQAHPRSRLEEAVTGQQVLPRMLDPYLRRIEYGAELAARWNIARGVVVDPAICFGKPSVRESGISTFVLSSCYRANNEDAELVADLFNTSPQTVADAVEFERAFAA